MQPLKAHVRNGRLVLDEPIDRPDGEIVYLQPVEGLICVADDDDLSDRERAELHETLEASIAEGDEGQTEDLASVVAELRQRR